MSKSPTLPVFPTGVRTPVLSAISNALKLGRRRGLDMQVVVDKLSSFETGFEVAEFLAGEGVKGFRSVGQACPLALWIMSQTGQPVRVTSLVVMMIDGRSKISLRKGCKEFVEKFDRGGYEALRLEVEGVLLG